MLQLLRYICDITAQRDRAQLEINVVHAMYDFLGVQQVNIRRLYLVQNKLLVGKTTWADASGMHHADDDLGWPDGTTPLADQPLLLQVHTDGSRKSEITAQGLLLTALPIYRRNQFLDLWKSCMRRRCSPRN